MKVYKIIDNQELLDEIRFKLFMILFSNEELKEYKILYPTIPIEEIKISIEANLYEDFN